jgi:hypothetical protein
VSPDKVNNHLELPFKPFTLAEVQRIIGCPPAIIDRWIEKDFLVTKHGQEGISWGLDYEHTWACFVGYRYLEEGSGYDRADNVVRYLAALEIPTMMGSFEKGYSFPGFTRNENGHLVGVLVDPPKSALGRKLDLKRLWKEFDERIKTVFPTT